MGAKENLELIEELQRAVRDQDFGVRGGQADGRALCRQPVPA
jgi:hypothetical protein